MHPADTTPEARRLQLALYRVMSPGERIALALAMSDEIRLVTENGIRSRNPSFDDDQVRLELLRILHGEHIARVIVEGSAHLDPR